MKQVTSNSFPRVETLARKRPTTLRSREVQVHRENATIDTKEQRYYIEDDDDSRRVEKVDCVPEKRQRCATKGLGFRV
jgi:hypothetical protein